MNQLLLLFLKDALWSGVAALGFAILFNVPKRTLPGCVLVGALGHGLRTALVESGISIELGTLAGATAVGFLGLIFARWWRVPSPVYTIPGVIPMVPGSFAFRTMIGILEISNMGVFGGTPMLVEASVNGIKTGLILAAIAGGIAAPTLLFRRHKPVV